DPDALRVMQLAERPRDGRRRVGPHPAGAHLVGAEQAVAARPGGDPIDGRDERIEVLAPAPDGSAPRPPGDLVRAGGLVELDLRGTTGPEVLLIELVVDGVGRDALPVRVHRDAAVAAVASEADEGAREAEVLHVLLVSRARGPWRGRSDQPRRVLSGLDQHPVA